MAGEVGALVEAHKKLTGGIDDTTLRMAMNLVAVGDVEGAIKLLRKSLREATKEQEKNAEKVDRARRGRGRHGAEGQGTRPGAPGSPEEGDHPHHRPRARGAPLPIPAPGRDRRRSSLQRDHRGLLRWGRQLGWAPGFRGWVTQRSTFTVAEGNRPEFVDISPQGRAPGGGAARRVIFDGPVTLSVGDASFRAYIRRTVREEDTAEGTFRERVGRMGR